MSPDKPPLIRHDPVFMAWDVRCDSPAESSRAREWLLGHAAPDAVWVDQKYSAGVTSEDRHRVGDYFQEVRTVPDLGGDPCCLRLVFHRRPDAGRFWKDVMVRILNGVNRAGPTQQAKLAYRGDEPVDWSQPALPPWVPKPASATPQT